MENQERFEQLLKQRRFKELKDEEKNLVFEFISSEEEYESLRSAEASLQKTFAAESKPTPRKETLLRIKQSILKPEVEARSFWLRPSVPAYFLVLLMIVCVGAGWWSGSQFGSEKVLVEKIIPRIDTVRIASKPDTVIKEKIIYVPLQSPALVVNQPEKSEPIAVKGVNMKDKEELERLLVSGSY